MKKTSHANRSGTSNKTFKQCDFEIEKKKQVLAKNYFIEKKLTRYFEHDN